MGPFEARLSVFITEGYSIAAPAHLPVAGTIPQPRLRASPAPESTMKPTEDTPRNFLGLRKLPARYGGLVLPLLLSILMTSVVSFVSIVRSVGLAPGLVPVWLGAWGWSWLVAFPTLLLVLPAVRRATDAFVERPGPP